MHSGQLNAGIIGLGVGEWHISGYEQDPRCNVVALCDSDPRRLREVGSRHPKRRLTDDADGVLSDPNIDVVSIASYDACHHKQIIRALENGKHVFVEKPLCLFENELEEMIKNFPDIQDSEGDQSEKADGNVAKNIADLLDTLDGQDSNSGGMFSDSFGHVDENGKSAFDYYNEEIAKSSLRKLSKAAESSMSRFAVVSSHRSCS